MSTNAQLITEGVTTIVGIPSALTSVSVPPASDSVPTVKSVKVSFLFSVC